MSNIIPVSYKQYDSRWGAIPYNQPGKEYDKTIKSSGCGPTSAAMLIATLKHDMSFTPVEACAWSVTHGYKYANQGTAYAYFVQQFKAFGLKCEQLSKSTLYNKPNDEVHKLAKKLVNDGYYLIALMGTKDSKTRGFWTTGGHYIVVWDWNDKVRILDPISSSSARANGDDYTFRNEVRQYWAVDARFYNRKDWVDMTENEVKAIIQNEVEKANPIYRKIEDIPSWYRPSVQKLIDAEIIKGDSEGKLHISSDTAQLITILDRTGTFDHLQKT